MTWISDTAAGDVDGCALNDTDALARPARSLLGTKLTELRGERAGSREAGWVGVVGLVQGRDLADRRGSACLVTSVDDDLGAVPGQLERDRSTDTRRRARHQCALAFEIVLCRR